MLVIAKEACGVGLDMASIVKVEPSSTSTDQTFAQMLINIKNVPEEQRQQNLMMGIMMGVMMVWFGWSVPAAVLLYYVTSAIWQVIQQQVVTKRVTEKVKAETEAKLAEQPVEINVVRKERKPRPKKKG